MSPIHSGGGGHMSCLTAGLTCEDVASPAPKPPLPPPSRSEAKPGTQVTSIKVMWTTM